MRIENTIVNKDMDRLVTEAIRVVTNSGRREVIALVGKPYSGKTTILRAIADHERRTSKRRVVFLPSGSLLYPDMTVYENILCPLLIDETQEETVKRRAHRLLKALNLSRVGDRYPHELAPDQLVRASLARALISDPDIMLLDELPLKPNSWRILRSLQRSMGFTVVWTTHDLREALAVADKILTIRGHSIEVLKTEELN